MNWEQFLNLLRKEKDEDIEEAVIETKHWYYRFTQDEVEIYEKEDTHTYSVNFTTYTGEV